MGNGSSGRGGCETKGWHLAVSLAGAGSLVVRVSGGLGKYADGEDARRSCRVPANKFRVPHTHTHTHSDTETCAHAHTHTNARQDAQR